MSTSNGHFNVCESTYCYKCGLLIEEWHNNACRPPQKRSKKWKARVTARAELFGWQCHYCFLPLTLETATEDHVIPLSKDGTKKARNTVLACSRCNNKKGDRPIEVFLASDWLARRRQAVGGNPSCPCFT